MLRTFFLLLALVSGFSTPVLAADTPPDVLARSTTQEVLAILKQDKEIQSGNLNKVYQLVEAKIPAQFRLQSHDPAGRRQALAARHCQPEAGAGDRIP